MKKLILIAPLFCAPGAFADVTVENKTDSTLTCIVTEKPVTKVQQEMLKQYKYGAFNQAHKGNRMEGGIGGGQSRTIPWKSKGHLLVWHFVLNGPSSFVSVPVTNSEAGFTVLRLGDRFKVQSK